MAGRALLLVALVALAGGCTLFTKVASRDAARDILSGAEYPRLLVEIDHPSGSAPNAAALDVLKSTLREVTSKASIDVRLDATIPSEPDRKYTDEDLAALERAHRNSRTGGDTAVLYVLYVAGGHASDDGSSRVLGLGSPGGSLVILKGNVRAATSGGLLGLDRPREDFVERAVLVHEFGHVVGLVNLAAPMVRDHEDPQHRGHSSNPQSVMYWQIDTTGGLASILSRGSDIPYQFDADDKADLKALREG